MWCMDIIMITIEGKLDMFQKVVFDDIENKNSAKKEKLIKNFAAERDVLASDLKIKKEHILQDAQKKAEDKKRGYIAEAENEAYFEILRLKAKLADELCDIVIQKFNGLSHELEELYKTFIKNGIKEAAQQLTSWNAIFIKMLEKDIKNYEAMVREEFTDLGYKGSITFEKAPQDMVGGFIIEDEQRSIGIDNSIKTLLAENRGMIENLISQRLDGVMK